MIKNFAWVKYLKWAGVVTLGTVGITILVSFIYIKLVERRIETRFKQLRSTRNSKFFATYPPTQVGQRYTRSEFDTLLREQGYLRIKNMKRLAVGTYAWASESEFSRSLVLYRPAFKGTKQDYPKLRLRVRFEKSDRGGWVIEQIRRIDYQMDVKSFEHPPKRLGYFFAGRLRNQTSVPLSDIPVSLRLAIIAIEDSAFLEHHGMSLRGTLRAVWKDLLAMKLIQGGSTITQQLMKNLFFSSEKVFTRKLKEALYAFITEARYSKEDILEAYLNEVYLGQWSTKGIHGMAEGARYYFNRPVSKLTLAQSAVLAGMVQIPNRLNPRRYPERVKRRRDLVLRRMLDEGFILKGEYLKAKAEPIVVVPEDRNLDDAAYYMDVVMEQLPENIKEKLDTDALSLYLPLNPYLQATASNALKKNISTIEKRYKTLQEKRSRGIDLQGALVVADIRNCNLLAIQGGRSFRETQFNRALESARQPGSLFKPFVYLTAFNEPLEEGYVTPLSELEDSPFEWSYEGGQTWVPRNYDEKFREKVLVRQALENSINIPTARLAQKVGIEPIVTVMEKVGIQSHIPVVPSISLGSAEVSPLELAQAYSTVARLGEYCELKSFVEVYDENRNLLLENKSEREQRLAEVPVYQTIQLLKGALTHGTGKRSQSVGLPLQAFAGKTGTTNDFKDAWFIGFSPSFLVVVWIGYDETENVGLPGSVAALPVWLDFMKSSRPYWYREEDFQTPEGLVRIKIDRNTLEPATFSSEETYWEYFVPGTEPG